MKLYYFNDTKKAQSVYVNDFHSTSIELLPQTGSLFEIVDREHYIPFIKVWESGNVLLSQMYSKEDSK